MKKEISTARAKNTDNRSQVQGSTFRVKDQEGIRYPKSSLKMLIFMKFHTRLQSTDFVVVLVPYKILIHENELEDEKNHI